MLRALAAACASRSDELPLPPSAATQPAPHEGRFHPHMFEDRRCIASHAPDSDYAPTARVLLWKLGYALLPASEAENPELRIVREERMGEVPEPSVPLILLTNGRGQRPTRTADLLVIGDY